MGGYSEYIQDILDKSKYQVGNILVFVGDPKGSKTDFEHGKHFIKGNQYVVEKKSIIDYEIDDLDTNYGQEALYFLGHGYGCFSDFAKKNFIHLNELREDKLEKILEK